MVYYRIVYKRSYSFKVCIKKKLIFLSIYKRDQWMSLTNLMIGWMKLTRIL